MVATISAGTAARYYLAQVEYYLGGKEPDGRWLTAGPVLAHQAVGTVEGETFERLHAARDDAGRSLIANDGGRLDQVGGYDATFSAPKSMSVLWGLADEPLRWDLEAVQLAAVRSAIAILNQNAAFCRRGRGGAMFEKVALTIAAFQHGEARPTRHSDGVVFADCALHTHAVILNLAQRADGSFGRLDGRAFFAWKMAAGAVYHHELARGLRQLGLSIEVTGTNGIFEVAGFDQELCRYFSARRDEIAAEMAELGLSTAAAPALAAAKARATRKGKLIADEDRHAIWHERAIAQGFAPEMVISDAFEVGRQHQLEAERTPAVDRLFEPILRALTERASTFEHRQLVAAIASELVASPSAASVDDVLARFAAGQAVVELARDRWGHPIYSTPEVIQLEQGLYAQAQRLAATGVTAPRLKRVEALLQVAGLNPEQEEAARLACAAPSIMLIEGGPGVGKTTLLAPVSQAWSEAGWRVIGASTAWKIAHQLRDDLGIEARAIDSWLAGSDHGRAFLTDKTLLLIDESGLITSRQMHRILSEVERAQAAGLQVAVRMVGDRKQLQPIGGPGLRIVADAVGTQRVDIIVRQRKAWARDVVTAFGQGQAAAAMASLQQHGCVHVAEGPAATVAGLVDAWDQWRQENDGGSSLLIAKTNAQVIALNKAARALLRAAGELAPRDEASVQAVTASGQTHTVGLARGDAIRFLCRNDDLGIVNGSVGELTGIMHAADGTIRLQARIGGRLAEFSPADISDGKGRAQMAHAYATTCYGAQGLTTDRAFVLADPAMDRHDIFVAGSRARGETHLFVNGKLLDAQVKSARLLSDRNRGVSTNERMAVLSAAFSRSNIKSSTLDYLSLGGALSSSVTLSPAVLSPAELSSELPREATKVEPRSPSRKRHRSKGLSLE